MNRPPIIYFAGKVSQVDYRHLLNDRVMSEGNALYDADGRQFIYGGPFAASCDHGCFHSNGYHGLYAENGDTGYFMDTNDIRQEVSRMPHPEIINRCYKQIKNCDIFYCFIDSLDCWGTFLELGNARALEKYIYVVMDQKTHIECSHHEGLLNKDELWFLKEDPGITFQVEDEGLFLLPGVLAHWYEPKTKPKEVPFVKNTRYDLIKGNRLHLN